MPEVIAFDTETYYDDKCSVKPLGAWAYCHHPEFYCYVVSVSDGKETWAGNVKDFNWSSLEGNHILSHNAFFDRNVYLAGVEKGLYPKVNFAQWDCTANLTSFLCNRRALNDACAFLLGIEVSKDERSAMKGKHWSDVEHTDQGKRFLEYAVRDAFNCWDIWNRYADRWPEFERELSRMTIDQCLYGVQIDVPKLRHYLNDSRQLLFAIEARIPWVAQGEKPTSTKLIAQTCRDVGIPCPPVKSHEGGEERFEEWEGLYIGKYPWVSAVAQWRSLNKFIGSLETLEARLRPDGTFSFGQKYFGAHTGRWSGDAGLNMGNLKKAPTLVDESGNIRSEDAEVNEYWECEDKGGYPDWMGSRIGMNGEPEARIFDIRSLFIARPGKKFVLSDLSQVEPRVLGYLAGHERFLSAVRDGYPVYEAAAIASGKYNGPKGMFKKNPALKSLYGAQKAQTIGLGYGCGWEKYIKVARKMASYDVCKNDELHPVTGKPIWGSAARKEVQTWRAENPEIASYDKENPGIWEKLDSAFKASLGQDFVLEMPSGRCLVYRKVARRPKKKVVKIFDEVTGLCTGTKIKEVYSYTAEIDGRRYDLYGGLLAENVTQALARDIFAWHMLRLKEAGIRVLWTVHDEAICEVPLDFDPKIVEEIMSQTPPWVAGLPLGAEATESPCYLK